MVVRVTPSEPSGATATLRGSFAGEGMGAGAEYTCLMDGDEARSVHGEFRTQVRAHATELQRIVIDGTPILLHIPPGGDLRLRYHPCATWQLLADWLDNGEMDDERTTYGRRDEACPAGFIAGGEIHEANDPRCGSVEGECDVRRCVRAAQITFEGATGTSLAIVNDVDLDGEPLERLVANTTVAWTPYGGFCPLFTKLATTRERVRIAPGVGERWTLRVNAGGLLTGSIQQTE